MARYGTEAVPTILSKRPRRPVPRTLPGFMLCCPCDLWLALPVRLPQGFLVTPTVYLKNPGWQLLKHKHLELIRLQPGFLEQILRRNH